MTLTYTYDNVGNRTSLSDSLGGVISYTYDARNELISEAQTGTGEDHGADHVQLRPGGQHDGPHPLLGHGRDG